MIEMHHMIVDVLRGDHQVANQLGIGRNRVLEGILYRAHRGDTVHQRAYAADTLGKGPRVARVATPQDDLDATNHRAGAGRASDLAIGIGLGFDAQVSLDAGHRIDNDGLRAHWRSSIRLSATNSSRLFMVLSQWKCACPSSKVWRQLAQVVTGNSAAVSSICFIFSWNTL